MHSRERALHSSPERFSRVARAPARSSDAMRIPMRRLIGLAGISSRLACAGAARIPTRCLGGLVGACPRVELGVGGRGGGGLGGVRGEGLHGVGVGVARHGDTVLQ